MGKKSKTQRPFRYKKRPVDSGYSELEEIELYPGILFDRFHFDRIESKFYFGDTKLNVKWAWDLASYDPNEYYFQHGNRYVQPSKYSLSHINMYRLRGVIHTVGHKTGRVMLMTWAGKEMQMALFPDVLSRSSIDRPEEIELMVLKDDLTEPLWIVKSGERIPSQVVRLTTAEMIAGYPTLLAQVREGWGGYQANAIKL